jgi:lipoprotein-releasing system permease protein
MRFESIVALRYLKARRKQAAISLITFIAILGVTAGVATLVIALSINRGFTHVTLLSYSADGFTDYADVVARLEEVDGVVAASPAIYEYVLLDNDFRRIPAYLKGIVPELEAKRSAPLEFVEGGFDDFGPDSVMIGRELARTMGSVVGDQMLAFSAEAPRTTPVGPSFRRKPLKVSGIFRSGLYEFDAAYAFVPIEVVQFLTARDDVAVNIEVELEDLNDSDVLGPKLALAAGDDVESIDWKSRNASIFQALQLERLVMFITIGLIVIVASLNIVVTLIMMVMEKTGDIAVLMAMGATEKQIRRIFIAQGVVIGVTGTVLGLAIGNVLSYLADTYRWVSIAEEVYSIAYVPFQTSYGDSAIVGASAIVISYLATIYPSRRAARTHPVEALRYE